MIHLKPDEERLMRLLEKMAEEGSNKFALVPLCSRFYLGDPRPPDWRYQVLKLIQSLSRKVRKEGGIIKKFKHHKIRDAYTFSVEGIEYGE